MFKEIKLALSAGYDVEVICFEFNNWSFDMNQELKQEIAAAKLYVIPANRKPLFPWFLSVFFEKLFRVLSVFFPLNGWGLSQAVSRRSLLILDQVKKLTGSFDLVIGHNPGALYPAYVAGKKSGAKTGFDVEDYHAGEGNDVLIQKLVRKAVRKYLPKMDYVTFASSSIKNKTVEECGAQIKKQGVILNLFPQNDFVFRPSDYAGKLRFVWFSQNVSYNRGLEQMIPVLEEFSEDVELVLIGNKKEQFYKEFIENRPFIKYIPAMKQNLLHKKIGEFDIGLAIEPGKDENNKLAISNKLLTYFQAGLYILASDTLGQKEFFARFPDHGEVVSLMPEHIAVVLKMLFDKRTEIKEAKRVRFKKSGEQNWENEAEKLLALWGRSLKIEVKYVFL